MRCEQQKQRVQLFKYLFKRNCLVNNKRKNIENEHLYHTHLHISHSFSLFYMFPSNKYAVLVNTALQFIHFFIHSHLY